MDYVQKIRNRLHYQNKNWLCVICGETGSGKSYSAISLAYSIAEPNNKVYIVFTPLEFFELINSGELKKGDVIIADEFGTQMSNREWQSTQNKMLGLILQVFRHLNLAVLFTVPHLSFIDVQARKLMHCYLETANIDYKNKIALLAIYDIQVSAKFDKIYYKHPIMFDEGGRETKISHLALSKPNECHTTEYELKKEEFSKNLRLAALNSLKPTEKTEDKKVVKDLKKIANNIKDSEIYTKIYNKRKSMNMELVRNDFGLTVREANTVRDMIFSKTYTH